MIFYYVHHYDATKFHEPQADKFYLRQSALCHLFFQFSGLNEVKQVLWEYYAKKSNRRAQKRVLVQANE